MKIAHQNFSVYEVEELRELFISHIQESKNITVNFENVQKIDFCGVALLISLAKTCEQKQIALKFTHLGEVLQSNISLCGADKILGQYYE